MVKFELYTMYCFFFKKWYIYENSNIAVFTLYLSNMLRIIVIFMNFWMYKKSFPLVFHLRGC
jgi:hypothetical protein